MTALNYVQALNQAILNCFYFEAIYQLLETNVRFLYFTKKRMKEIQLMKEAVGNELAKH